MALPSSTSRGDLIRKFHSLGWEGPFPGRKHQFMRRETPKVRIPNPPRKDVNVSLLAEILRQAGISHEAWNDA
jgi:predicted RNA binding protein YcfA (HicA-like mRNA interferase family)